MTQPFDLTATRSFLEQAAQQSEFTTFMGTHLRSLAEGMVEIEVPLRSPLTQHHGYAHGAVVGYLADTASAWAAATLAGDVVTAEYKLNLLAPAKGELLWARAEVIRSGRSQLVVSTNVYARSGGVDSHVGACLATIVPVRKKQPSA